MGARVLFMTGNALLIDTEDNHSVHGYAEQGSYGLYCTSAKQETVPISNSEHEEKSLRAMMALAAKNQATQETVKNTDNDSNEKFEANYFADSMPNNSNGDTDSEQEAVGLESSENYQRESKVKLEHKDLTKRSPRKTLSQMKKAHPLI